MRSLFYGLLCVYLVFSTSLFADELELFVQTDENLEGFEEIDDSSLLELESFEDTSLTQEQTKPSWYYFSGFFREEVAFAYEKDSQEWTKIKSSLNLNLDLFFPKNWKGTLNWNGFYDYSYNQRGREEFSDQELEENESESEIRDFFIQGSMFETLNIKIGRQIIAWGLADQIQVTDQINPIDQREQGLVSLEDARIPVTATLLNVQLPGENHFFDLVAVHEIRGNKQAAKNSDFDPYISLRNLPIPILKAKTPESNAKNTEFLARYFYSFHGGEVFFMAANIFDNTPYLEVVNYNGLSYELQPQYKRIQLGGVGANFVFGSWLWKFESSFTQNKAIARNDLTTQIGKPTSWSEKNITNSLLGFEYTGISDVTLAVEGMIEHIIDYESYLTPKQDSNIISASLAYSIWQETLQYNAYLFFIDTGIVVRNELSYDLIDALTITFGIIVYDASKEDSFIYPYRKQDRIFSNLKYSF